MISAWTWERDGRVEGWVKTLGEWTLCKRDGVKKTSKIGIDNITAGNKIEFSIDEILIKENDKITNIHPINKLPASPKNIFAGYLLKIKNPVKAPTTIIISFKS